MKIVHVSLDIKSALRGRAFKGFLDPVTGRKLSEREAEDRLLDMLSEGLKYLPIAECEGFDPQKGCPGHEVAEGEETDGDGGER